MTGFEHLAHRIAGTAKRDDQATLRDYFLNIASRYHRRVLVRQSVDLEAGVGIGAAVHLFDGRPKNLSCVGRLRCQHALFHNGFRRFEKVERWVELCLITFLYLEWYRAEKLKRRDLSAKRKQWWRCQRAHGLCVAVRQETEERELDRLANCTKTKSGMQKLKKILRDARPIEQRQAA